MSQNSVAKTGESALQEKSLIEKEEGGKAKEKVEKEE